MQFVVERGALLRGLAHVASLVETRTTIPILTHVLVQARSGAVHLRSTDLEREASEVVPADVAQDGSVAVPARMLLDIVKKQPSEADIDVSYDAEKGRISVKSGKSRFAMQTLPADDFPSMAAGDKGHSFELAASEVSAMLAKTKFAMSTEETRFYLNGIYWHVASDALRAVATDGHRLAQYDLDMPAGAARMSGVIIPRKTVHELSRLLDGYDGPVNVLVSPTRVRFEIGPVVLTSKLIDGSFPDYQRVIPQGNDKAMRVSNATFMAAVDRVSTIAANRSNPVKLSVAAGHVKLSSAATDGGSAVDEVDAEFEHAPIEIGFNAGYLMEIGGQIDGDSICLMLSDPGSPALIRDPGDARALYVIMPMRVV